MVNSLGWKSLRPVQEQCIGPILGGDSILVLAPTAGGKTEAAVLPILSRALTEGWTGMSILYVCPIKALLNNLLSRLEHYCRLVGRRCGLWHGDTTDSERRAIVSNPPDILLTTPESLEVLLVMRHRKHPGLLAQVRVVVVDEMHAFAGDDRGWHLLSVIERIQRIAGLPLQRIGLSATVGNASELLQWLTHGKNENKVIDCSAITGQLPDVQLDFVGSLENAATVIAALHKGEKRLVFCDSRARVEQLGKMLRDRNIETFVSHSSLSGEERKQAEAAFAGRSNCVIVATSTLELGIDVGDLDRVIQIDSPSTVASFLQRIGRSGRRPGTRRNYLFLATNQDALIRAAGLIQLWSDGYVEPVKPPRSPFHIFAQQLMALALQEGGIAHDQWAQWIGSVSGFAAIPSEQRERIIAHMLNAGLLTEDRGLLWIGDEGEAEYGHRHFMELLSSFTAPPLIRVMHGRNELGLVDQVSFAVREEQAPVILLAGKCWQVKHIDWNARVAFVEPTNLDGKSQWMGTGPALSFELCQSIQEVIASESTASNWSRRASQTIEQVRSEMSWCQNGWTIVQKISPGKIRWWTFAGLRANASIASALGQENIEAHADNLFVLINSELAILQEGVLDRIRSTPQERWPVVVPEKAITGLKFNECIPKSMICEMLQSRQSDARAMAAVYKEPLTYLC